MTRLTQRLHRLEATRRPLYVAAVLRRVRQCASADLHAVLVAELTAVDPATAEATLQSLTDAELDTLVAPLVRSPATSHRGDTRSWVEEKAFRLKVQRMAATVAQNLGLPLEEVLAAAQALLAELDQAGGSVPGVSAMP